MKRKEMLDCLSKINLCVPGLIATYDMGIQFCAITSEGVCDEIGDIGSWPNIKFKVNPEIQQLQKSLRNGENITNEQMMEISDIRSICSYRDYTGCYELNDKSLNECLDILRKELLNIKFTNEFYYVYAYIEDWEKNIKLFDTLEALTDYFKCEWASDCRPFEDMDDEELEYYYEQAKEAGWNKLPLFEDEND